MTTYRTMHPLLELADVKIEMGELDEADLFKELHHARIRISKLEKVVEAARKAEVALIANKLDWGGWLKSDETTLKELQEALADLDKDGTL